jgi:universal stress protein E
MSERQIDRVLVAIKPWQRGLPLEAQHAGQLAQAVGAELMLASAVFDARIAGRAEHGDKAAVAARARMLEAERVQLERLARSLRDWRAAVETRVVWEAPAYHGILQVAREWAADLVAVGVHEHGQRLGTRLTDTDWQLMRLAPCAVLLVKDRAFDGYPRVLAAVDPTHPHARESGSDAAVLGVATRLSEAFDAELRVVHALPVTTAAPPVPAEIAPGVRGEALEQFRQRALDDLLADYDIAGKQLDVARGKPAAVIAGTATERRVALVVIGALRRGTLARALGSTTESVAMDAPCDVLLVPPPEQGVARSGVVRGRARKAKPHRRQASSTRVGRPRHRP